MRLLLLIEIAAVIGLIIWGVCFKCTVKCPTNRMLVVFRRSGVSKSSYRCIHGGRVFVLPFSEDCEFLELDPFSVQIRVRKSESGTIIKVVGDDESKGEVLTSACKECDIEVTAAISSDVERTEKAAQRLLGLDLQNVKQLAEKILLEQLVRQAPSFKTLNDEEIIKYRRAVEKDPGFDELGLDILSCTIRPPMQDDEE